MFIMNSQLLYLLSVNSVIFAAPMFFTTNPPTPNPVPCGDHGDCLTVSPDCTEPCGCDYLYFYNNITDECLLNFDYLKQIMTERFNTEDHRDFEDLSPWAKKLRTEAEKVFGGIIVAVIIFGACTALCTLTACIYCAHINYTDRMLRKDVKALSQKLTRDGKLPKKPPKKPTEAKAQSCNVVVEDAGVFVC